MKGRGPDGRVYAREIERRWSRLHGRPIVLSPKDWVLVTDWHARGVPLSLIDEAMQAAGERRAGRHPPRSLAYIVPAVEESWGLVLDGRRRGEPLRVLPVDDPLRRWREVAGARPGSRLADLLHALLERVEAGEAAAAVDERLDRELATTVEPEVLAALHERIEQELAPFAERMDPETLAATARAAVVFRLRRELGLPGLARS